MNKVTRIYYSIVKKGYRGDCMTKRHLINVLHIRDKKRKSVIYFIEKVRHPDGTIQKNIITETDPKYTYYLTNKENWIKDNEVPVNFIEKNKVHPISVPYDNLLESIYTNLGFSYHEVKNNAYNSLRDIYAKSNVHLADLNLVDYKIREYLERYKNELDVIPLEKVFMDIEVDIYDYDEFPHAEIAPCKVCLTSYFDDKTKVLTGMILYDETNASQQEFLTKILDNPQYSEALRKEYFPDASDLVIEVFFDEVELIKFIFAKINIEKPDFVLGWNFYFDVKTLEVRLEKLLPEYNRIHKTKLTKESIMCGKEFIPLVHIEDDTFNTEINKKKAKLNIASASQYVDMKYCYATIRTGMGKKDSWSLDAIAFEELDTTKTELDGTIKTAIRKNFERFFIYSMTDSYLLWQIDLKTKDIDLLYNMSVVTFTQFIKVMTKTTSLRNLAAKILDDEGYVLSNNRTRFNKFEKKKFKGA